MSFNFTSSTVGHTGWCSRAVLIQYAHPRVLLRKFTSRVWNIKRFKQWQAVDTPLSLPLLLEQRVLIQTGIKIISIWKIIVDAADIIICFFLNGRLGEKRDQRERERRQRGSKGEEINETCHLFRRQYSNQKGAAAAM